MAALTYTLGVDGSKLKSGLASAASSVGAFGATIVAAGAAMGTALIGGSVAAASSVEKLEVAFTALLGTGEQASEMMGYLRDRSLATGASVEGMAGSMQKLIANGMGADQATALNESLLDIAGTLGMSSEEANLLGSALAQVKAKGVASMEELRQQIAERGVPVFEALAAEMGVTTEAVIEMVGEGKVGADVVMKAFTNLSGPLEKFRGGAEKMADTTGGSFGVLSANLKQMFVDIGTPLLGIGKSLAQGMTGLIQSIGPVVKGLAEGAANFINMMVTAWDMGMLPGMIMDGLMLAGKSFINLIVNGFRAAGAALWTYFEQIPTLIMGLVDTLGNPDLWSGLMDMFAGLGHAIGAAFLGMLPQELLDVMGAGDAASEQMAKAEQKFADGFKLIGMASEPWVDALVDTGVKVADSIGRELDREGLLDVSGETDRLGAAMATLRDAVSTNTTTMAEGLPVPVLPPEDMGSAGLAKSGLAPAITSLAKIGGMSIGTTAAVQLDKERNSLLKQVVKNTAGLGVVRFA
jgi:tape measure domain-containing protein